MNGRTERVLDENGGGTLFAEERKQLILELINKQSKVTVHELCDRFSASPGTIRNDLQELEDQGMLKRTHGGAMTTNRIGFEPKADEKDVVHYLEKQEIARSAVGLIDNGDTIAIDTGTTTMELVKLLGSKKDLTVVTNDLKIALELERFENMVVIMTGGTIRRNFHCTVGPQAIENLSEIRVDKTFLAANGVSLEAGITTPTFDMADVKRKLISIASESVLLCDSSKIGRASFKRFADIGEIRTLVTDRQANPAQIQAIRELGITVLTASDRSD